MLRLGFPENLAQENAYLQKFYFKANIKSNSFSKNRLGIFKIALRLRDWHWKV